MSYVDLPEDKSPNRARISNYNSESNSDNESTYSSLSDNGLSTSSKATSRAVQSCFLKDGKPNNLNYDLPKESKSHKFTPNNGMLRRLARSKSFKRAALYMKSLARSTTSITKYLIVLFILSFLGFEFFILLKAYYYQRDGHKATIISETHGTDIKEPSVVIKKPIFDPVKLFGAGIDVQTKSSINWKDVAPESESPERFSYKFLPEDELLDSERYVNFDKPGEGLENLMATLPVFRQVSCRIDRDSPDGLTCGGLSALGEFVENSEQLTNGWKYQEGPFNENITMVYTWVDGSDPVATEAGRKTYSWDTPWEGSVDEKFEMPETLSALPKNRVLSYEELRYALRSAYVYGSNAVNNIVVITGDYPEIVLNNVTNTIEALGRANDGIFEKRQIPSFLNKKLLKKDREFLDKHLLRSFAPDERIPIAVVHHSEFFENATALPTFNSMAIESQLYRTPYVHPNGIMVYSNDDMYFSLEHKKDFFYSKKGGLQIGFSPWYHRPKEEPYTQKDVRYDILQFGAIQSQYLSRYFGFRTRSNLGHSFVALPKAMTEEVGRIFHKEVYRASFCRRRDSGLNAMVHSMTIEYLMEMQRVAVVDSLIDLVIDENQDGIITKEELNKFLNILFNEESLQRVKETSVNAPGNPYAFESRQGIFRMELKLENENSPKFSAGQFNGHYYADGQPKNKGCQLHSTCRIDNSTTIAELTDLWIRKENHCGDCIVHAIGTTFREDGSNTILANLVNKEEGDDVKIDDKTIAYSKYNLDQVDCDTSDVDNKGKKLSEENFNKKKEEHDRNFSYLGPNHCIEKPPAKTADESSDDSKKEAGDSATNENQEQEKQYPAPDPVLERGYGVVDFIVMLAEKNILDEKKFETFVNVDKKREGILGDEARAVLSHIEKSKKDSPTDSPVSSKDVTVEKYYRRRGLHRIRRFLRASARYRYEMPHDMFAFGMFYRNDCGNTNDLLRHVYGHSRSVCVNDDTDDKVNGEEIQYVYRSFLTSLLGDEPLPGEDTSTLLPTVNLAALVDKKCNWRPASRHEKERRRKKQPKA